MRHSVPDFQSWEVTRRSTGTVYQVAVRDGVLIGLSNRRRRDAISTTGALARDVAEAITRDGGKCALPGPRG